MRLKFSQFINGNYSFVGWKNIQNNSCLFSLIYWNNLSELY